MKGRPGMLVAWSMTNSGMDLVDSFEIKRHVSGQTGDTMIRAASATNFGGTLFDYVPGFVPRYTQLSYNDENQIFGTFSIRQRGQGFPANANQVLRSFSFQIKCPASRADKTIRFQVWRVTGGMQKLWESEKKLISNTSFAWAHETPNIKLPVTGQYRITMLATTQTASGDAFGVRMHSGNPYGPGNAVYYWDGGGGINAAWYINAGWDMVFKINGPVWAFVDHYAPGSGQVTYWVYPYRANGKCYNYKSGYVTYNLKGVWLLPIRRSFGNRFSPTTESLATCIRNTVTSPIEFRVPEHQQVFRPIGVRKPVIKSLAPPGYEFTIEGQIVDTAGLSGDEYRRRLEILYGYTNELSIVFVGQGMSFPVAINNLRIRPKKAHWYEVSLDCYQTGEFSIPEMLTVPG